ncbi:beta-N-acetylhexosaminidase [Aliikangiella sp. G2MR2-5]|uniref:beta-N-acetylhexosaminidase n=1 Tax=Aliikangiella sp. G2MR2-5 TaxID=2788943 RepID=UPI0018ABB588|nr:beta-N-acetylhexosaminidase [Aliikangiella sp. G2MR2-5]
MGQIGPVMLDIDSTHLTETDRNRISNPLVGGLILFSRNFVDADQILALTSEIRSINPEIIIAVDQEGGRVQRFIGEFSTLPALGELGKLAEKDLSLAKVYARDIGKLMALEVQSVGCDISFAPVLDLGLSSSRVIGNRAFSTNLEHIIQLGGAYISGMKEAGMAATGKHYPGHGSIEADSHFEIPLDERELDEIKQSDIKPFCALAGELGAIMPAHIIFPKVDEKPAGFSKIWLDMLRQELNFDGVIFSDDLSMKGAETAGDFKQRADAALAAGCDMVLVCNNLSAADEVLLHLANQSVCDSSSNRLKKLKMATKPKGLNSLKESQEWMRLSNQLESFKRLKL